jgi:hypothetical protein
MTFENLLQEVRSLPIEQRKQLVTAIFASLTSIEPQHKRSLLDFEGAGEALRDEDAQEYINRLRDEWDERS